MRRIVEENRCVLTPMGLMDCAKPAADDVGQAHAVLDPDKAMNLAHPEGLESGSAAESETSPNDVASDVPCTGAGARSVKNIVKSQAANGAVNGESVRTINQAALTRPNIGIPERVAR